MVAYTLSASSYLKIFFHSAKHPHQPVNGVLLGKKLPGGAVHIDDAVPLLHHWTSLSPMMEIGLDLAGRHADSVGLKIVGYYQACERLDDTALAPVGERLAEKIRDAFPDAVAFVIDGEQLGGPGAVALIPYVPQPPSSWRPAPASPAPFSPGSPFQLSSPDLPGRALALVRDEHAHQQFGDFDDHLEDVSIDWLRNQACLPSGL